MSAVAPTSSGAHNGNGSVTTTTAAPTTAVSRSVKGSRRDAPKKANGKVASKGKRQHHNQRHAPPPAITDATATAASTTTATVTTVTTKGNGGKVGRSRKGSTSTSAKPPWRPSGAIPKKANRHNHNNGPVDTIRTAAVRANRAAREARDAAAIAADEARSRAASVANEATAHVVDLASAAIARIDEETIHEHHHPMNALHERSCYIFTRQSRIRHATLHLLHWRYFPIVMLFIIITNCILIAFDEPTYRATHQTLFDALGGVYAAVFTIEAIMKMITFGVIAAGPHSYLRDPWNVLVCHPPRPLHFCVTVIICYYSLL
jgi:hypothetical protein